MKINFNLLGNIIRSTGKKNKTTIKVNHGKSVSDSNSKTSSKAESHPSIIFSDKVLDAFREDVGKYYPETGGMFASSKDSNVIDRCYFDMHSKNTHGTFYYDVETMSEVYRGWKSKGYTTNGIYHSHPAGAVRPSYHDISTALLHLDFFKLDYFYLPIFQPQRNGQYRMYFYVVRRKERKLEVTLEYILKAEASGYSYEARQRTQGQHPHRLAESSEQTGKHNQ